MKAEDILTDVETTQERVSPYIRECANVFHDNEGELFTRSEAADLLTEEVDIDESIAREVLAQLVGDTVDPIVQIFHEGEKYIGVIEFHEFDGAYGYINYDDQFGKGKRIVCQQCVDEATLDSEVTHATENDPMGSFADGASWDELLEGIHQHYEQEHETIPGDVETGATLASGTTIGGNNAFHQGNDGSGSGLAADTVRGNSPSNFADSNHGNEEHSSSFITESQAPVQSVNGETGNISISGFSGSHTDLSNIGSSDHHTRYSDEEAQDATSNLLVGGDNVNLFYDDGGDSLTISVPQAGSFSDDDGDTVGELIDGLSGVQFDDGEFIEFGTGSDVSVRYDSANDNLRWQDNKNSNDKMALDRTSGDLRIEGQFIEGQTL